MLFILVVLQSLWVRIESLTRSGCARSTCSTALVIYVLGYHIAQRAGLCSSAASYARS